MLVSETIGQEALFFGSSILVGAGLFLLYDMLRIFRRIIPHGVLWVGAEDFFYWLICTGVVFVMLYRENDGMVRGFALLGMLFGMAFYYLVCSRCIISVNVRVWKGICGGIYKILRYFLGPPLHGIKKAVRFLLKRLKKIARTVKMSLCKL